jgi:hypothetical protein
MSVRPSTADFDRGNGLVRLVPTTDVLCRIKRLDRTRDSGQPFQAISLLARDAGFEAIVRRRHARGDVRFRFVIGARTQEKGRQIETVLTRS